jgi:hypothetical protein
MIPVKYIISPHWIENQAAVVTLNVPCKEGAEGERLLLLIDLLMLDLIQRGIIRSTEERVSVFLYVYDAKKTVRSLSDKERKAFWSLVSYRNKAVGEKQSLKFFPLNLVDLLQGYLLVLHLSRKRSKL